MPRELAFSVTKKDLEFQTLKGSGPGGQHRNKRETGVRVKHPESGATAVATDNKSQAQNKKEALRRLVATPEFRLWVKRRVGEMSKTYEPVEKVVEGQMAPQNLLVEERDDSGGWRPARVGA